MAGRSRLSYREGNDDNRRGKAAQRAWRSEQPRRFSFQSLPIPRPSGVLTVWLSGEEKPTSQDLVVKGSWYLQGTDGKPSDQLTEYQLQAGIPSHLGGAKQHSSVVFTGALAVSNTACCPNSTWWEDLDYWGCWFCQGWTITSCHQQPSYSGMLQRLCLQSSGSNRLQ